MRAPLFFALTIFTSACASSGATTVAATPQPTQAVIVKRETTIWPMKTRENVDLWLHGFGMLTSDSGYQVPLFKPGYRDEMVVAKNQANVITQLDANIDRLKAGIRSNPGLTNAQFAALYFANDADMRAAIDAFIQANGDPRAAASREQQVAFNILGSYFPTPADRTWLSLFASSLWDESARFYHSYWMYNQRARGTVIDSVQGMWQHLMRPRIQRFLNNTQQTNGDIILSLTLGGEGRTLSTGGSKGQIVTVPLPERPSDAPIPLYVIAHEVVAGIVNNAVADNVTPAQERSGVGDRLRATGAVRGGLILLEQLVPELADGYARYYLTLAGVKPNAKPKAQIAATFAIPDGIRDGIASQIESVQSGI